MSEGAIARALRSERLFEVHSGVYSVVPPALMTTDAWHAAAILAGGPGACLCAATAGWRADVWTAQPPEIHVAVGSALKEIPGVRWHRLGLGSDPRELFKGMPTTALARVPLDMARELTIFELKGVLAELEFHHDIHPDDIRPYLRRGYPGAAKLRRALDEHTPQLAETREGLERAFAEFLIDRGFALPEFNHPVGRATVDAMYHELMLAIELDGVRGHKGERRILRDHRRDLHRRADGYLPLRYHFTQIINPRDQALVEAELERLGVPRNRVALPPPWDNRVGPSP